MASLNSDIKVTGVNQNDLVTLLENIRDMCNANKTAINAIIAAAGTSGDNQATIHAVTTISESDITLQRS